MKLYNSLTRRIEEVEIPRFRKFTLYVCGVTPYDTTHIGHAFTYVFFDTFRRFLLSQGFSVEYTQNVTDIDDDILKRAKETNQDWQKLGQYWTGLYLTDMDTLHVDRSTFYTKATEAIPEIIEMVSILIKKGHAYEKEGTVYYDIVTFPEYGKLSHFTTEQMIQLARERGADPDDPQKKQPLDFILWQKSKADEPSWDSPWGKGRPGWHIECSSMIYKTLGTQIDFHGGGRDLIYPHHESEIAQSEGFSGKAPFVRYWMHTAMVLYQGEKMSKSLKNLVLVSDLLKTYSANAIRYVLLSHHYRKPWEFEEEELEPAEKKIIEFVTASERKSSEGEEVNADTYNEQFVTRLSEDMDIPGALQIIETLKSLITEEAETKNVSSLQKELRELLGILGIII